MSADFGSGMNACDAEMLSRAHCTATFFAIGEALFDEDNTEVVNVSDNSYKLEFENATKFADDIVPIDKLSRHEIAEGATAPHTVISIKQINGIEFKKPLRALIDTGATRSFIYESALPADCNPYKVKGIRTTLLNQVTTIDTAIQATDFVLPEFAPSMHVTLPFELLVSPITTTTVDIILGQDFNTNVGMDVLNSRQVMTWRGNEVPL
jgi:hypothetical protein